MTAYRIDDPGTVCAFESRECSNAMSGHGGFDEHHEYPLSLGGLEGQSTMLALCPNHHRRQHALIRYLVELSGAAEDWAVVDHYTPTERDVARSAVAAWIADGSPVIKGWPCPAARA